MRRGGLTLAFGLFAGLLLFVATPGWGTTWTVADTGDSNVNGANLGNAINSAALGDTILLTPGAIYNTPYGFTFPNKGTGTGTDADYITLQPSDMTGCPAAGTRVSPASNAAAMPKLVNTGGNSSMQVNVRAHHWKFVCLEMTDNGTLAATTIVAVANAGSGPGGYATYDEMMNTHHIVFDRVFVHPSEVTASNLYPAPDFSYRSIGIVLTGVNETVTNSWIGGFSSHYPQGQSIAIEASNTSFLTISNNEIGGLFNGLQLGFSQMVNPANTATATGGTAATYTAGSGNATFSNTAGLSVGNYVAFQLDYSNCPGLSSPWICWGSAQIDTINSSTGTVTYHAIGPTPNQAGWVNALLVTPTAGGTAAWNGFQTNNVSVTQNRFYKPFSWQAAYPSAVKNFIEQKSCVTCLFEGNVFEGSSDGNAMELHNESSGLGAVWATFRDETWRSNLFLWNASEISILLLQVTETNTPGQNFTFTNNLYVGFDGWTPPLTAGSPCANGCQMPVFQTMGGQNITITHNTIVGRGASAIITAPVGGTSGGQVLGSTNTVFKDNVVDYGLYGFGNSVSGPNPYLLAWPATGVVTGGNVVPNEDMATWCCPGPTPTGTGYFSDPTDHIVPGWSAVGLLDLGACHGMADQPWAPNTPPPSGPYAGDYTKCALASTSVYKGTATDGADPGVDMTALQAALNGTGSTLAAPSNLQVQ